MLVGVAVEYAVEIEGDVVPGEGVLVRHAQAIAFARLEVAAAAPDAPDEYHNIACVVLAGYLYDAPPSKLGNAWANSGAAFILRRYLIRRAVPLTEATA